MISGRKGDFGSFLNTEGSVSIEVLLPQRQKDAKFHTEARRTRRGAEVFGRKGSLRGGRKLIGF